MTFKKLKKSLLFLALFMALPLWAHENLEDHDHSNTDDEDFTLFERNQDNLDWNQYDYPDSSRRDTNLDGPESRGYQRRHNNYQSPGRW